MTPSARIVVGMLGAGAALRWAGSPGASALAVGGLALAFAMLWSSAPKVWALGGALLGLVHGGAVLVALAKWGPGAMVALWLAVAAGWSLAFCFLGVLAHRSPSAIRPAILGAGWCLILLLLDHVLYTSILVTSPLALEVGAYRRVVSLFGAPVAEGLVVLATAGLVAAFHRRQIRPLSWIAPILVATLGGAQFTPPSSGQGQLHAVQPNFSWRSYAERAWSLLARDRLRETLDDLTREASRRAPGTIVWPENGSGLADGQLRTRRRALRAAIGTRGHDLLITGTAHDEGRRHVSTVLLSADATHEIDGFAHKAHLVPIAEGGLTAGQPTVLDARAGRIGVSICFDVLFSGHVRALVEQGADLLSVTSDNASFGPSLIAHWHRAHAVMRAAESQRSLLFMANRGPSVAYDVVTNEVTALSQLGVRTVASATLHRVRTQGAAEAHLVSALFFMLPLLIPMRRRGRRVVATTFAPMNPQKWATAMAVGAVFAAFLEVGHVAQVRHLGWSEVMAEAWTRARGPRGVDVLSAHFVQSTPKSCGRAALAYALTQLGARQFEEDLTDVPLTETGASLKTLSDAVHVRGLQASALRAERLEDLELGPGAVALLHLSHGHYVVASALPEGWVVFDPARGRRRHLSQGHLEGWSGAALRVALPDLEDLARTRRSDPPRVRIVAPAGSHGHPHHHGHEHGHRHAARNPT